MLDFEFAGGEKLGLWMGGFKGKVGRGGELLLQHHHVSFLGAILHLCLESGAKSV